MTAYTAICEQEDGWWVVTVPELESGRVTQARTLDEVPETVADLVATMTGADPMTVQVKVEAEVGPGLMPAEPPGPAIESWTVEAVSLPDGSVVLYHAPPGLTEVERRARERKAREFAARMYEQDERDEPGRAG